MTANSTSVANILKTYYPQSKIPRLLFAKSPFLGKMKKSTSFYGANAQISSRYSGHGGGSATFSTAQSQSAGNKYGKFLLTHAKDYSVVQIETLAVVQAESNTGALVRTVTEEADGGFYDMERSLSKTVWGNGGGARGQVGSVSTTALTLSDPNDVVNFEVGMLITGSLADGTSGTEITANTQAITAIDEDAGILYGAGTWNGTTYADNNYLFRAGDFGVMAVGFNGWIPATAPTSGDSFFSFDRSVQPTRFAGIRYTATAADGNIERALISASARAMRSNARPTSIFMHPTRYGQLVNELGARARYDQTAGQGANGKKAQFGFTGLCLHGVAGGMAMVYPDPDCPNEIAAMVDLADWEFMFAKQLPGFINQDGKGTWLRMPTEDAMEARIGYYGQICCHAPGHQVRVNLAPLDNL